MPVVKKSYPFGYEPDLYGKCTVSTPLSTPKSVFEGKIIIEGEINKIRTKVVFGQSLQKVPEQWRKEATVIDLGDDTPFTIRASKIAFAFFHKPTYAIIRGKEYVASPPPALDDINGTHSTYYSLADAPNTLLVRFEGAILTVTPLVENDEEVPPPKEAWLETKNTPMIVERWH